MYYIHLNFTGDVNNDELSALSNLVVDHTIAVYNVIQTQVSVYFKHSSHLLFLRTFFITMQIYHFNFLAFTHTC